MQTSTFDSILDEIETLSIDEQAALLVIMHRRLSDRRRTEIAANIAQENKTINRERSFEVQLMKRSRT
ncbi:hypothetical protein QUA43_26925 [Microcoleus sp. N9_B4]|uniref:hypothetical protein n=1 Tax=Microcoleus sp. N9_B4 TaxID=3055386 RepID=UPI002FD14BAC